MVPQGAEDSMAPDDPLLMRQGQDGQAQLGSADPLQAQDVPGH